jgi:predicted Rossmann fold flavoprotein
VIGLDAPAAVLGAGPAGLFLAARLAAEIGPGVILLERGPRAGRKLLASGSGRCNLTHVGTVEDFLGRYGSGAEGEAAASRGVAARFLKKSLYAFTNADLAAWFLERGLALEAEEGGKLFPASRRASDVLGALLDECASRGVELRTGCRITSARAAEGGFDLAAEGAEAPARVRASLLAIATGGKSYPGTGSEGDGYAIASALGHGLVPPRPALSPAVVRDFALSGLAGIGFEDRPFAVRRRSGSPIRARGDILITHEGFSGPAILDASRYMSPGDSLEIDFAGTGLESFREALMRAAASSPRALARNVLAEAGLPRRMAELYCSLVGLRGEETCATLRRESREALCRLATAYSAEIREVGGFDRAMATSGGVPLAEVDPTTMESRLAPGLYFAGEVLDYDGDTGGYNLQAAFSTAAAAARAMARRASGR